MSIIDFTERSPRRFGRPGAGRPSPWSAERAFQNEVRQYDRGGRTRGWNPGGFDSSDIHPMDTGKFRDPEYIGAHGGVQLWKTATGHYAVGKMHYQWWAVPMGDVHRRR